MNKFDKAILTLVQRNNQLTHSEIGEQVGLSNSAVRRRLSDLRKSKIIEQDVSILKPDHTGVIFIVTVSFAVDTPEGYAEFDVLMKSLPHVKQSYHISGIQDYVLIVHGPSLQWYEDWAKKHLMTNTNLKRHDTSIVYSCKKFETAIEI
ncbi:Lrp/AsnC family transcriptional regulator [Marinicella sp. W31]|uniref:Lrp/AsnC family transcriptional regulator n=1 Tax=Marinicella sp. W31 TaxID=3023713 RepID=UPI003756F904